VVTSAKTGYFRFEGECLLNYATTADNKNSSWLNRLAWKHLSKANYPISLYYSGEFKQDTSNWHIPNLACFKEWMKTAGLEIRTHKLSQMKISGVFAKFPHQRISGFAVKSSEILPEHVLVEDIAPMLKREAMALIKRKQPLTVRQSVSRILARMLGLLGLKRVGYKIVRANNQ
jgi:hypothetical protein